MEKEFIPYKLALAMKELGYNEKCITFYEADTTELWNGEEADNKGLSFEAYNNSPYMVAAPLYQQAFRWFREKYNLFGEINLTTKQEDVKEFEFFVLDINEPLFESDDYKKYKEAELACLEKLIEIVEEKNKKS